MPITPHFHLSQTDTHVELRIRVPHVRVTAESIQVVVDCHDDNNEEDSTVHFSSPPYLLVLQFAPYKFHATAAEACARYEPTVDQGTVFLSLRKETAGVTWSNLDLLGQWTKPQNRTAGGARWLQQVVVANVEDANKAMMRDEMEEEEEEEEEPDESTTAAATIQHDEGYGFLRRFHGIYTDLTRDGLAKEMLEIPWTTSIDDNNTPSSRLLALAVDDDDDDTLTVHHRRREMRLEMENDKFDVDRYWQDFDIVEDYVYQCAMSFPVHWAKNGNVDNPNALAAQLSNLSLKQSQTQQSSFFTEQERLQLVSIPYPLLDKSINDDQARCLVAGLVDLLFAYVYDHMTTSGDPTVESAWTVSTLSATLACLEDWLDDKSEATKPLLMAVGHSCLRRSLIYPYLRNFEFGCHCWKQVQQILDKGMRCVIRCLLQLRSILDHSELYYLGNKLWLDPYLAWLQRDAERVEALLKQFAQAWPILTREHVSLDLVAVERQISSIAADENKNERSEESSEEADDDSSSSSSDSDSDDESSSSSASRGSSSESKNNLATTVALLDENVGHSILRVVAADSIQEESDEPLSSSKDYHTKPLIEEVQ